jgi:tetratricopeptide (TPR) repeat protein
MEDETTIATLGASALGLAYAPGEIPAAKRALIEQAGRAMWALFSERGDPRNLFQQLTADYGSEPGVHYLAGVYWLEPDPQKARQEFEKELAISPSHLPARLQLAILDIKAGDADAGLRLGMEAVKLEPDNALAHTVIARAYEHSGDYVKAIPQLETAIRLAPDNPQLHFSLSQAYTRVGKTAEAAKQIAEFQRLKSAQGAQ